MNDINPIDWRPTASLDVLKQRADLVAEMRSCFHDAGYWEVHTPILSRDIVVDAHIDPFITRFHLGRLPDDNTAAATDYYLQTSPEFAMKRLLAAGADAIYQVGPVMRNGEVGEQHNPEFLMAEWYRVGDDHHAQMDFTESLVSQVFAAAEEFHPEPKFSDEPFERLTYEHAFERYAACGVLELDADELANLAETHDVIAPESMQHDRDEWLNLLLSQIVEPELGFERPVFLYDYPATQAALAKVRQDVPPVAERFELYINGTELCNGYHELTDAEELRRRFAEQNQLRETNGARRLPEHSGLLEAMEAGFPACAGVALGVDRLIVLALGLETLRQGMAFPFDRA